MDLVRYLLGVKQQVDDELDRVDQDEIDDYSHALSSPKYADSHTKTGHIERLLSALDIDTKRQNVEAGDIKPPTFDASPSEESNTSDLKTLNNKVAIHSILCRDSDEILPGQPTYEPAKFGKTGGSNFKFKQYNIPIHIYRAVEKKDVSKLNLNRQTDVNNYVDHFQNLLWIEETQQALEMRRYDMYDVLVAKDDKDSADFFKLDVPGLAEGRPSLIRGDRLILRSDQRSSYYEGYIYEVRETDILFKLNVHLHSTKQDGLRFNVQFISSRTPYRRCHLGVSQFAERSLIRRLTFPIPNSPKHLSRMFNLDVDSDCKLPCFNAILNRYQRKAICNILKASCRPAPYIIFGPPGTGKTVTLIEAALQVVARTKEFRILVCANSNSSTDLCCRRIVESGIVPKKNIVRVSAFYRMEKLIPADLEDVTKCMDMIDCLSYKACRVVVTTCIQAGSLYEFFDRFDYVFIDEAGHASEPEALIPIGLLNTGGCCVLAGDPHQLGPICTSNIASEYGLGLSLLERLYKRSIYQRNKLNEDNKMDYNELYITKLRICYRCDPRVLTISNKLFYDNDLKCVNETPKKWLNLIKTKHPLIFHGVKGKDRREWTNPSWFNPAECIQCLSYVKRLYSSGLHADQLGVITPYRRQIDKLNLLFESCALEKCKIATMEEFQGDEREIIIISLVRTRKKRLDFDKKFNLGFLFNPKRFNVALSRAKWMCIVIGEPQLLSQDNYWRAYMDEAYKLGDWRFSEPSASIEQPEISQS